MGALLDAYLTIVWVWMKDHQNMFCVRVPEGRRMECEIEARRILRPKLEPGLYKGDFTDDTVLIRKDPIRTRSMSGSFNLTKKLPIEADI